MLIKTLAICTGMLALVLPTVLAQEAPKTLPEDKYKELYENVCGGCHGADKVIGEQRDLAGWGYTVHVMSQMGTSASEEELDQIVNYLVKYFGTPVNMNTAGAEEIQTLGLTEDQAKAVIAARAKGKFPDFAALTAIPALKDVSLDGVKHRLVFPKLPPDPNRQIYLNTCGACHAADVVVGENHDREFWGKVVGRMRENGARGSDDDFKKITDYLLMYFGPAPGSSKQ
jgi:mono/diheme cytochrome c family protein